MRRIFGWTCILGSATFAASVLFGQISKSDTLTVNVPATSNPYLAGLPNGTNAREGDRAPQQSPVLVQRTLSHAIAVTFGAVGAIRIRLNALRIVTARMARNWHAISRGQNMASQTQSRQWTR